MTGGSAEADGLLMAVSDDADIDGSRALIVVGVDPSATTSGGSGAGGPRRASDSDADVTR